MARNKTTVRFEVRLDKPDNTGLVPIRMVYQVAGQRKYFNAGRKIYPEMWDDEAQEVIYLDKAVAKKLLPSVPHAQLPLAREVSSINHDLQALREAIKAIEDGFRFEGEAFSASMVINKLNEKIKPKTKREDPSTYVADFILHQFVPDSENSRKGGTLKVYTGLAAHIKEFEKQHKHKMTFAAVGIPMLKAFSTFLISPREVTSKKEKTKTVLMNNTTAAKQISTLKTVLNTARVEYKIPVNQDYRDFTFTRKDSSNEVIVLTQQELQRIIDLDLSLDPRLDRVRDIFVFACATGLRISDLQDLKRSHIRNGAIVKMAVKTGQALNIPLNTLSSAILQKYGRRVTVNPLPMISEQKINQYLKEVGALAGIDTPIEKVRTYGVKRIATTVPKYSLMSVHMGRRTFTTHCLEKGISRDETMKLTGHSTYAAFKRYVDISQERIKESMAKAWGAPAETA